MLLSEAIKALLVATRADGRSERTVDSYEQRLRDFLAFLGDQPVGRITVHDIRAYAAHLRSRKERYVDHPARERKSGGLSPFTVASYLRAVKRLFNWLVEEGIISESPARRVKLPKLGRHEPKAISREDFLKLLKAAEGDDPWQRRARALLLFLADTGCRRGGLEYLRVDDVDLEQRLVRITEKGSRARLVPFSEVTREALEDWLEVRPEDKGPWLFTALGPKGKGRLTGDGIRQILDRLAKKAGVKGPVNPHSFRHAFAREYLLNGGDLATLADLLGHSSVQVTWEYYSIFRIRELQERHDRFSPVARLRKEGNGYGYGKC
ncbi:MAG TPA: tyrosine-type recombinase/integrase [Caldilineae bacterium]|nr:tyrosine-type recombinase/integrase [Caldilineae bacterium]